MSPDTNSRTCPKCGAAASGKFCHGCGAPVIGEVCPKCKANLSPGAKFCHACGSPAQGGSVTRDSRIPWIVAACAVVVSVLVLVVGTGQSQPAANPGSQNTPALGATNINDMTPLERADRLFEVVMIASERGDTARVRIHAPMALTAYDNLDSLDGDAQYHVGLLRGAIGDLDGMLAMADSLQAVVPGHLLATTLRKAVAEARNDSAGVAELYRTFLADYGVEANVPRREYRLHQRSINAFLNEARRATAGEGN